jgi:hypothetical protein
MLISSPPFRGSRSTVVHGARAVDRTNVRCDALRRSIAESSDHEISGRQIRGGLRVVHVAHSQKDQDIGIVRLCRQRVDEEEHRVHLPHCDPGRELGVSPFWPAEQLLDVESHFTALRLACVTAAGTRDRRPMDEVGKIPTWRQRVA